MPLLVRKIEKAKWMQNDILADEDVSADAITNCMKTTGNTLSTWQIQNLEEISEAVLAIVSSHQHLDTIDVICIDRSMLEEQGVFFRQTPGRTPVNDLIYQHIDISNLTYSSLGTIAKHIVNEIKQERAVRYTKGMAKNLLNNAINDGRITKSDLHESVRAKL